MGLLTSMLAAGGIGATYAPDSDFWYQKDPRLGATSYAGMSTSPEQAMRLGAVYACVRVLADMIGWPPLHTYHRRADGGKDRALDVDVYPLLRRRPNQHQTAIRWRQMGQRHVLLRGNFYNYIETSTRRIRSLVPLDPDRMKVTLLDNGRRGYLYRAAAGQSPVAYTQDEIFHVMGLSLDGITGCSVIEYARESIGRSLAEELHAARFWSKGGATKGALVTEGAMTKETREANQQAWHEANDSVWNSHKTALLSGGLKWIQIGVNARDAQYLEGREFSVADIARFFGVPPHMIGDVDRSTSWGSGIEQQSIGFLQTTMEPWYTLWEQEIDRQLLYDDDDYFAEFLRDAMLKADLAARTTSHRAYVDGGIMSVNEVRDQLNLNPVEGEAYDTPIRAQNIGGGGDPAVTTGQRGEPAGRRQADTAPDDTTDARARAITLRAATRTVQREIQAIQKWAPRYAGNPIGWREWVCDFYGKHVSVLEEALGIEEAAARRYGAAHAAALLEQGLTVLEEWERHAPAALTAVALGEEAPWETTTAAS